MRVLKFLIEKEFKQTLRNPFIPKLIVFYPVLVLLIFPWAINFEVRNIKIDVVDQSKGVYSQRLVNKIDASSYFILNEISPNYPKALRNLEQKNTDIILEIPSTFDNDLIRNQQASVSIAANAVNSNEGLLGTNYLTQIVNDFASEILEETYPLTSSSEMPQIEMVPNYRYNKTLDYKTFMLPAFIVLIVTLICGILPSMNIVLEKETGTIQQINTTPVNRFVFILAKLIPYWIIGILIITISFLVTWMIYGLLPKGNFLVLYLVSVIFILGISGMGIIISNYSQTLQQSMFLMLFFILIILLISGLFTPVTAMPKWAQYIAYANPLTYFMQIMRQVYLKGSSLQDILNPILWLIAFAVFFNGWAALSYRKR